MREQLGGSWPRSTHHRSQQGNEAVAMLCPTQPICGPGKSGIEVGMCCCSCCTGLARSAFGKGMLQQSFLQGGHFEVRVEVPLGSW